jgi:glutaminyl-peptide cyclotransferase
MVVVAVTALLFSACADPQESSGDAGSKLSEEPTPLKLTVKVLAQYPHDRGAFTQGLIWFRGKLIESAGYWGQSNLRLVELETGAIERQVDLPEELFAEGLARVGDQLIQLTFKAGQARVYDVDTFQLINEFSYSGEGWGLCFDGQSLVMSDGTSTLAFRNPATFAVIRKVAVQLEGEPVEGLNELECAEGWIYANLYQTDTIVRVDPVSGDVRATIDASGLLSGQQLQDSGVLNGIAYKSQIGNFLLTGKNWPAMFEVVFTEAAEENQ